MDGILSNLRLFFDISGLANQQSTIKSPSTNSDSTMFSARKMSIKNENVLQNVECPRENPENSTTLLQQRPTATKILFSHLIEHSSILFEGAVFKSTSNNHWVERRLVLTDSLLALSRMEDCRHVLDSIPLLNIDSTKSTAPSILKGSAKNQKKPGTRIQFHETATLNPDSAANQLQATIHSNDDIRLEIRADGNDGKRWELRLESAENRDAWINKIDECKQRAIERMASISRRSRLLYAQLRLRSFYQSSRVQYCVCICIFGNFALNIAQAELVLTDAYDSVLFDRCPT